ncbi:hypothetical protein [Lactococcus lactis]|uniref:Uncharacterized protein n=1 Tax=Lactococcus lactis TaxID=1358 RepID=A0AAP4DV08_9LACT|nr:hypothetical protein [Lactococcus lactis]MDG4977209.1 hypothetical protein [Lactococcus lactis]TNU78272.1 hypothetical protein FIB48_09565 [Lactococcus lactis subsp. lactis]
MNKEIKLELLQFLNVALNHTRFIAVTRHDDELKNRSLSSFLGKKFEVVAFEDNKYFQFKDKQWVPVTEDKADRVLVKINAAGFFEDYKPIQFGSDFPDTQAALEFWEQINRRWVKFSKDMLVLGIENVEDR